jgi:DNA polymerase (family 10)
VVVCRTGSREHNIMLASIAKSLGLHWNPQEGVFRGEELIASETEESIFSALGLDYERPEDRT